MASEQPGVQQGGARAFRATITTTIITFIGTIIEAIIIITTVTISSTIIITSIGTSSVTFICAQNRGVSVGGGIQGTISASCHQLGGVQRGHGRGRLWRQ